MSDNAKTWHKEKVFPDSFLNIISDASIMSIHIANGKMVPLIIVDSTSDEGIKEIVLLHSNMETGEISTIWGASMDKKSIFLHVKFKKPVERSYVIQFDILEKALLIEYIIQSQLLYIQAGKAGDRLMNTMDYPKILVEVDTRNFRGEWYKLFIEFYTKYYRKQGLPKKKARQIADHLYNEISTVASHRMPNSK